MKINFSAVRTVIFKTIIPSVLLTGIVLAVITPVSCKLTEEGIQLLTGDFSVPHLTEIDIPDGEHIVFEFNKPVKEVTASVCCIESSQDNAAAEDNASVLNSIAVTQSFSASMESVTFTLTEKTAVGLKYCIEGTVTDCNGNTLTFSIPFSGYNYNMPELIVSEIRNAYTSSTDKATGNKKYKCEFVELFSLTDGNLSGVEVFSAGDGLERKYVFPSCEIKAGEYIVLHLRNKEEGCIDETGDDLTLSYATDSCNTSRDFWALNDKACIANSDVIIVRNSNTNDIIDAVLFAQSSAAEWPDGFAEQLSAVEQSGIWLDKDGNASCSIQSAFLCDGITSTAATRTMSRQNIPQLYENYCLSKEVSVTNCADQWIITANKGSGTSKQPGDTPGFANSTNAYVK